MKTILAGAICSLALAGCAGQQQAQPAPVAQPAPAAVLSDECPPRGGVFASSRAPGTPRDPFGVLGKAGWPQEDSCVLVAAAFGIHTSDGLISKGRESLHNAAWVGRELEIKAGGMLHLRIPEGQGVTADTAVEALLDASNAVRDAKERITGILTTVAATANASPNGELDDFTLDVHRARVLKVRVALDDQLREIGTTVLDHLVPGSQAARAVYLYGVPNHVDSEGFEVTRTGARVPGGLRVSMSPVEK